MHLKLKHDWLFKVQCALTCYFLWFGSSKKFNALCFPSKFQVSRRNGLLCPHLERRIECEQTVLPCLHYIYVFDEGKRVRRSLNFFETRLECCSVDGAKSLISIMRGVFQQSSVTGRLSEAYLNLGRSERTYLHAACVRS